MLDLAVRKQDIELVIAHEDDDLSWTTMITQMAPMTYITPESIDQSMLWTACFMNTDCPAAGVAAIVVKSTFTIDAMVDTFDQDAFKIAFANILAPSGSDLEGTVTLGDSFLTIIAGSINVEAAVSATSPALQSSLTATIENLTPVAASTALGITDTARSAVVVETATFSPPAPPPPPMFPVGMAPPPVPPGVDPTLITISIGMAAGALVGLIAFLVCMCNKKKSAEERDAHGDRNRLGNRDVHTATDASPLVAHLTATRPAKKMIGALVLLNFAFGATATDVGASADHRVGPISQRPGTVGVVGANVAVCLLGQPRSLTLTARSLRTNLLEHWAADAFVIAHTDFELEPTPEEVGNLRGLLGSRVVAVNLTAGVSESVAAQAAAWSEKWKVYGHPLAQWAGRQACHHEIVRHEKARGVSYSVYVRLRLDTLLLAPVPLLILHELRAASERGSAGGCDVQRGVAVVPSGEDYGGVNDRVLFGDACTSHRPRASHARI